jgi:hypothetical protein
MSKSPTISELLLRIEKLERAVFNAPRLPRPKKSFDGATGGIRLLIEEDFFARRRHFREVESELEKHGYHYSKQAMQMPLTRLSSKKGPLVALKEKGRNVYVKRK